MVHIVQYKWGAHPHESLFCSSQSLLVLLCSHVMLYKYIPMMIGTASTHGQSSAKTVSKSFSLTGLFDLSYARALGGSKDDKAERMDG